MAKVDREHYLRIAKEQGLSKAITELHHEMKELEYECFEGPKGYNPKLFEDLKDFRKFSVELWKTNVDEAFTVTHEDIEKKRH